MNTITAATATTATTMTANNKSMSMQQQQSNPNLRGGGNRNILENENVDVVTVETSKEVEHEMEEKAVEDAVDEWEKEHNAKNKQDNDNDVEFAYGPNGELDKVVDVSGYLGKEGEIENEDGVDNESEQEQEKLYQETRTAIEEEGGGYGSQEDVQEHKNVKEYYETLTDAMTTDELLQEEDFKQWGEEEFVKNMAWEEEEEEWEQEYISKEEQEEWEQKSYYDYDLASNEINTNREYYYNNEYDYEYVNGGDKVYNGVPPTLDEYGFPIETEDKKISQDWNNDPILNQESEIIEAPGSSGKAEPPILNHVVDGKIVANHNGYDYMNMNSSLMVLLVAIVGVLLSLMAVVRFRRGGGQRRGSPAGGAGYEQVNPGQTYHFGN
jgi:hypothetical protein